MKKSESRVLMFLKNVDIRHKFASNISMKLNMDYGYTIRILRSMKFKKWVVSAKRENKVFYSLSPDAPLEEAEKKLTQQTKTTK